MTQEKNKNIIHRKNEPASIFNRDKLELCPPNVDITKWHIFREKYNKAAKLELIDSPAQIDIELNSNCNLKCKFCIQSVQDMGKQELSFSDYQIIIDQCKTLGITSLKLNYMNEPLLKRDIWKYIQYAKDNGFINIFFSTNGILLTEKNIKKIIESGVTKIFVSLDAFTKETYTKLRGYSGFKIIQQNILNFLRIRKELNLIYPLIRINFLKNKENISELDSFISFWENKADMINIQEMNELLGTKSELYIEKQAEYRCSMPFKQLVINSWGDILPCCTMHGIQHKIGNVRDTSLQVAWNSPKINYLRDLHKNGRIKENVICKTCIYG